MKFEITSFSCRSLAVNGFINAKSIISELLQLQKGLSVERLVYAQRQFAFSRKKQELMEIAPSEFGTSYPACFWLFHDRNCISIHKNVTVSIDITEYSDFYSIQAWRTDKNERAILLPDEIFNDIVQDFLFPNKATLFPAFFAADVKVSTVQVGFEEFL